MAKPKSEAEPTGLTLRRSSRGDLARVGQTAVNEGDFVLAEQIARLLLRLAPDRPQGMEITGRMQAAQGFDSAARETFHDCLRRYTKSNVSLLALMEMAAAKRDWIGIIELAETYGADAELAPTLTTAVDRLAGLSQLEAALRGIDLMVDAGTTDVDIYIRGSRFAMQMADLERNGKYLAKLRELRPHNVFGYLQDYHILSSKMRSDDAYAELIALNERFPKNALILSMLCERALDNDDAEMASHWLKELEGRLSGARIRQLQVRVAAVSGSWKRLLELTPQPGSENADARSGILRTYAHTFLGETDVAQATIDANLDTLEPDQPSRRWFEVAQSVVHFRQKRDVLPNDPRYVYAPPAVSGEEVPAVVRMLWVGGRLSPIEHLSLKSWIDHGFDVELYAYDELGNVPSGCRVMEGEEILPRSAIFAHSEATGRSKGSFAGFADIFRWHLLERKGGFWSDCDVVCLKAFDLPKALAISTELAHTNSLSFPAMTNCFYGGPAGHPLFRAATAAFRERDVSQSRWGEYGTQLIGNLVDQLDLEDYALPCRAFNSIGPYQVISRLFRPENGELEKLSRDAFGLHLYNEVWRSGKVSKHGPFPRDSLIHAMFARHDVIVPVEPDFPLQEIAADMAEA